ncbi:capsule biosynthesis protein [Halochromatium sp.]
MRRHFLFLQGGVGPLFAALGARLERAGHKVSRLNFCMGDWLVWRRAGALAFQERLEQLPAWLDALCSQRRITDMVLFGACRPVHRPALALGRERGLRLHLVEEGYLRPHWITIERGGVNGESPLPRDPDWYRRVAPLVPSGSLDAWTSRPMGGGDLLARAAQGGCYQCARIADPVLFPHYRSHRADHPLAEAAGWLRRFGLLSLARRPEALRIERFWSRDARCFLLPLQLHDDAQVLHYSRFRSLFELIDQVIASFAQHAPPEAKLLIKQHPLDSGLRDYAGHARRAAVAAGLANRVQTVETGELSRLLETAAGLVTINSTSGLAALLRQCPTIALGQAIYDLPGLTFQGPLDQFWWAARRPEPALVSAFIRTLLHTTQLRGNLYTAAGVRMALSGIDRFMLEQSPLEALLERCPVGARG